MMLYKRRNYPPRPLRHGGYPRQPRYDRPVFSAHRHSDRHSLLGTLAHQPARQRALPQPAAVRRRVRGEKAPASCTAYTARRRRSITCRRTLSHTAHAEHRPGDRRHLTRGNRRGGPSGGKSSPRISALVTMPMAVGLFVRRPGVPRDLLGQQPGRAGPF